MGKIKLDESYYDEESGYSYVLLRTDLGYFLGEAFLSDEDKDIASRYAGCNYAERRAVIKYYRYKVKLIERKLKNLKYSISLLENHKYLNYFAIKTISDEILSLEEDKDELLEIINMVYTRLTQDMKERPNQIKKINEKKEKQSN